MTNSSLEIGNPRPSIAVGLRNAAAHLMRPRWAVPIAGGLLVLFGACDYLTGVEVAFTLLYLIPVGIVTWSCGAAAGGVIAALATAGATFAELSIAPTRPWLVVWNGGHRRRASPECAFALEAVRAGGSPPSGARDVAVSIVIPREGR